MIGLTASSQSSSGSEIGLSPANFGPFSGYRAKLCTRVILGPAQRHYIEKGTLPPKSAPQNKIGLKFLLQKVEIFRRQPSPVSIGLSPICSPAVKPPGPSGATLAHSSYSGPKSACAHQPRKGEGGRRRHGKATAETAHTIPKLSHTDCSNGGKEALLRT